MAEPHIRRLAGGTLRALGYLWALPTTCVGFIVAVAALLTGGRASFLGRVLEVHGGSVAMMLARGPLAGARIAAVTLGHVVYAPSRDELERSRSHERVHVKQCERWGPLFLPAYAIASLWAFARGRDPYRDNRFEREAIARSEEVP